MATTLRFGFQQDAFQQDAFQNAKRPTPFYIIERMSIQPQVWKDVAQGRLLRPPR